MSSMQYTIRSIPPKLDEALRRRAQRTGKSLNQVTIDALVKGAGLKPDATFTDLDWFIGNKTLDCPSFNNAMDWLDNVPKEIK